MLVTTSTSGTQDPEGRSLNCRDEANRKTRLKPLRIYWPFIRFGSTDASEVERVAIKYMRKGFRLFDKHLNILTPRNCLEAATLDGSNTILLVREADINIDIKLESSVSELPSTQASTSEEGPKKRGRRGRREPSWSSLCVAVEELGPGKRHGRDEDIFRYYTLSLSSIQILDGLYYVMCSSSQPQSLGNHREVQSKCVRIDTFLHVWYFKKTHPKFHVHYSQRSLTLHSVEV